MPALFNYKRCDGFHGCAQPQDCEGVKVCPTGAIRHAFRKDAKIPTIDLAQCIDCGKCKGCCPAGVIFYYQTEAEKKKIKQFIEEDGITPEEIWEQRYGVQPNKQCSVLTTKTFPTTSSGLHAVDFWDKENLLCRVNAIKIDDLPIRGFQYHKLSLDDFPEFKNRYRLRIVPSLLFFKEGIEIGRLEGALGTDLLNEAVSETKKLLES